LLASWSSRGADDSAILAADPIERVRLSEKRECARVNAEPIAKRLRGQGPRVRAGGLLGRQYCRSYQLRNASQQSQPTHTIGDLPHPALKAAPTSLDGVRPNDPVIFARRDQACRDRRCCISRRSVIGQKRGSPRGPSLPDWHRRPGLRPTD